MGNSFTKFYLCSTVIVLLSSEIVYSQVSSASVKSPLFSQSSEHRAKTSRVKWTWRLPPTVKNTFNNSEYANWFIEKIVKYDSAGKTIFRFHVNNGNLLDGDHYDSFLRTDYVDIMDNQILPAEINNKVSNRDLFPIDPCFYRGFFYKCRAMREQLVTNR